MIACWDTLLSKDPVKARHLPFFDNTPYPKVIIKNRSINTNKVIDPEKALINRTIINAVAFYKVENDKIVKVTYLPRKKLKTLLFLFNFSKNITV